MVTSCLLRLVLYFAIFLSSSTVSQAISLMVSFFAPITRLLQRLTGRSSFTALLCPTAAAMAGVTSPSIESADKLLFGLVPDSQLVIPFLHTLEIPLLTKRIYILAFESGRNEIRFLCNFSDDIKNFVNDIVLAQPVTNFLHAIFALCVFIL